MYTIVKVFIEFVTVLSLFWFFSQRHLSSQTREAPSALEGEVLTRELPESLVSKMQILLLLQLSYAKIISGKVNK